MRLVNSTLRTALNGNCCQLSYCTQGYYEGAQLLELTSWLAAAGLEAEAPLLAAICSLPWPYKPSLVSKAAKAAATAAAASAGVPEPQSPNSFSYWAGFAGGHLPGSTAGALGQFGAGSGGQALGFTAAQAGVQPGGDVLRPLGLQLPHKRQLMAPSEMQRHRPNGYLGLVAPALYGEAGELADALAAAVLCCLGGAAGAACRVLLVKRAVDCLPVLLFHNRTVVAVPAMFAKQRTYLEVDPKSLRA